MKKVFLVLFTIGIVVFTGCKTAGVPDPVKTGQVKDVAETLASAALRRVLSAFPEDAPSIAIYTRSAGKVLCAMHATGQFDPVHLEVELAAVLLPRITNETARLLVLDIRDGVLLIYKTFYRQRFVAELPADQWPAVVAEILCKAIDKALIDSGRPGVAAAEGFGRARHSVDRLNAREQERLAKEAARTEPAR